MKNYRPPFSSKIGLLRFLFRPAVAETRKVRGTSSIQQLRRISSAVIASDVPKSDIRRKRVLKAERKAMLESFVNQYRVMNGGKFPPKSLVQKEVGGSYYVLRVMLQELEYNSKMTLVDDQCRKSLEGQMAEVNDVSVGVEEASESSIIVDRAATPSLSDNNFVVEGVSGSQRIIDARFDRDLSEAGEVSGIQMAVDATTMTMNQSNVNTTEDHTSSQGTSDTALNRDFQESGSNHLGGADISLERGVLETPNLIAKTLPEEITKSIGKEDDSEFPTTPSHAVKAGGGQVFHRCKNVIVGEEHKQSTENSLKLDSSSAKLAHDQDFLDYNGLSRHSSLPTTETDEPPKKSSLLGNLKSFVDSIMSIWRKL
ncbi:hypothetical protein Ancab_012694 [Ancistrocladus abbreviatus]